MEKGEKGCEAKHMADHKDAPCGFLGVDEVNALLFGNTHRFLEQDVVSDLQSRHCRFRMLAIERATDEGRRELTRAKKFLPGIETVCRRYLVNFGETSTSLAIRLGD